MNPALQSNRTSIAIVLVTLALSAWLLARGASACLAAALPRAPYAVKRAAAQAESPPGPERPDLCAILARNIFDCSSGALCPAKAVTRSQPSHKPPPPLPGETPPPCLGQTHKLVAAVCSERDPTASFAELTSAESTSRILQQGDRIGDDEIFAIHPTSVHFKQSSGTYCSLAMFGESAPSSSAPLSPAPANIESGITPITDTHFTVQRGLVDTVLQDPASVLGAIRVVPHFEHGQTSGLKVYGIRADSLLHQLGVRNGDLLRAINGLEIATPDAALEAYSQLRGASNLSVSIERRGQPMTIAYVIE